MPSGHGERYDFFLSRRGSVAATAQEVTDVLTEKGYRVLVQDYDIPRGASFVEVMHDAVTNARDLVILFTTDYLQSPYTRKEFTSFEAQRLRSLEERHIVVLRCDGAPLVGLLSDNVYENLVGVTDTEERKRRIIAAAERQSLAEPPPPRPFIGVPPRIASFTGRDDELDRLDAILMKGKPAAVTQASVGRAAVQGLGGMGKTSLAIEYAHRFRGLYAGVCWCPAETRTGLLSALAPLAVTLGIAPTEEADVEKAAKAALRRLAEQRATWLLIYDNVVRPDHIADLLPSSGAKVLITSRFSDWVRWATEVQIDVLPVEQAVALLEKLTERDNATGAKILADALGNLPLALDHAGAYCRRTQTQFVDYAAKVSTLIVAAATDAPYPKSVAATFQLAISQAVEQCQAAEPLMAYLAQCSPERIPMTLVEGAVEDEAERLQALAALAEFSLVKHDPFEDGTPAVTVHRLVQAVARAPSEANGSIQHAVERLIAQLKVIYPEESKVARSWSLCAQFTPHLLALRDTGSNNVSVFPGWPDCLERAVGYFYGRGACSQAVPLARDALGIRERALGPEHPETVRSLGLLAVVLHGAGDLAGARPFYERALAIREKALGSEHPEVATSLSNLAALLYDQGDLAGARPLFERALAIHEKAFGPEHPLMARSLHNLAVLLCAQGDYAGARPLHERALAIREKALGPEDPEVATSLNNLAVLLSAQGDFAAAQPLYERALAIHEHAFGPEHPDTAMSLHSLAGLLKDRGDFAGARPLYERALAILEKAPGPDHPDTARSLNEFAVLLSAQGDFAVARPLYERALAIRENALGPEHHETATSLHYLALLLSAQGDLAGARPLYERALAIREKALGPDHQDTARSLHYLAMLLSVQGDLAGARPLYERALAIREKALGSEHPEVATSLSNLATLLCHEGDFTGARTLHERALAIHEKALGPEHPTTNRARCELSRLLLLMGRTREAFALSEAALNAQDRALGRDHPWTEDSACVTADALDALGRTEEARALREKYGLTQAEKPKAS